MYVCGRIWNNVKISIVSWKKQGYNQYQRRCTPEHSCLPDNFLFPLEEGQNVGKSSGLWVWKGEI